MTLPAAVAGRSWSARKVHHVDAPVVALRASSAPRPRQEPRPSSCCADPVGAPHLATDAGDAQRCTRLPSHLKHRDGSVLTLMLAPGHVCRGAYLSAQKA
jgi:hypothetical protein